MKKIINMLKLFLFLATFAFISLNVQDLHERYLLNYKGASIVSITNLEKTSGGTGFHIKTPSGNVYILTNAHVCEIGKATGSVYVSQDEFERPIPRKILEVSRYTDLCLVEALPENTPLKLASGSPYSHQEVYVLGHPRLYPLTLTKGRIITQLQEIKIIMNAILSDADEAACNAPKNKIEEVEFFFKKIRVCTVVIPGYLSTVQILPGNSGSPVVNKYGNVVAVVFAGDGDSNWGVFVIYEDLINFLKYY